MSFARVLDKMPGFYLTWLSDCEVEICSLREDIKKPSARTVRVWGFNAQ